MTRLEPLKNTPSRQWAKSAEQLIVGKDVLELLTSSMYVDPMVMYREYIQNSADALDEAKSIGALMGQGLVTIKIDRGNRTVTIRDNGIGLRKHEFGLRLSALGGSKKRGTAARGFRGVGRLAGLAFAREIVFRSRQPNEETVHELCWSGQAVRAMLRSPEMRDLRDVVADAVQIRESPGDGWPERFFEVELRGVIRHRDDMLLDHEHVANYLAQVAPVPFHPDFRFGDEIRAALQESSVHLGNLAIEVADHGRVYRPHTNHVSLGKAGTSSFRELTTTTTFGRDGSVSAVTWILHSEYRGALPAESLVSGWRFRVGDIQIGSNDLLMHAFAEPRFNHWCVAETHVVDHRILPNGRRDDFEQSAHYLDLLNYLAPHAREISKRCRSTSIQRNLTRKIENGLVKAERELNVLSRKAIVPAASSKLITQIGGELDIVERMASRPTVTAEQQLDYRARVSKLRRRVLRASASTKGIKGLSSLPPRQRTLLIEVFNTIYEEHPDVNEAQRLVEQVLKRLSRRSNRRK